MCGRFAISHIPGFFSRFMIHDPEIAIEPRYNIAPTQDVPVVVLKDSNRLAIMMKWGLVPFWAKDPKIGSRLINARAETIASSPVFRASARKRRCLVPATGFYEWRKTGGRKKTPYYCHLKGDELFAFAGLFDRWRSPHGTDLLTFTIVTTSPNALVSKLHNRMPVILRKDDEIGWLAPGELAAEDIKRMTAPYPAKDMEVYAVSPAVGDPKNESEDFVKPLGLPGVIP